MQANDETTSCHIQKRFQKRGFTVHASTVRRSCKERGWTLQNTRYCQIIREANKAKRLEYAQRVTDIGDTFHNVVFSDECSIFLQQFRRTCYRKIDERAKRKPKPKHPLKVHVWVGISRHCAKTGKNKTTAPLGATISNKSHDQRSATHCLIFNFTILLNTLAVCTWREIRTFELHACGCFFGMLYSVENLMRNLMRQAQSENEKKIKGTKMGAYMVYF